MSGAMGLYVRPRFIDGELLTAVVGECAATSGDLAEVHQIQGGGLVVDREVRRAWELELSDDLHDRVAAEVNLLHSDLEAFFKVRTEPCDAVAALRYPTGAFYRTHRDVSARPTPHGLHRRAISIVVFVNSAAPAAEASFGGGVLRLYDLAGSHAAPLEIVPVAGTLVAFPSGVLHEVTPVEWGIRLSLVTWLSRRDHAAGASA